MRTRDLSQNAKRLDSGCLVWLGYVRNCGYAYINDPRVPWKNRRTIGVHRYAWIVANGREIPEGMCVCHHCDVRTCIEPSHLFIGTKADNNADMRAKGRQARADGANNNFAKLTAEQVFAIRASRERVADLARLYGVHRNHVYRIRSGKRWATDSPANRNLPSAR